MSNINGLGNSTPIARTQAAKAAAAATPATPSAKPERAGDKVEVNSTVTAMLTKMKGSDVRLDKVQDIRAQLDAGTYDIDGKLDDAALNKMLDDMF